MKSRYLSFVMVLAALIAISQPVSAMYHPSRGRFMQRDPNGMQAGPSTMSGRPLAAGPAANTRGFIPRDPIVPDLQYADGMNLYQYEKSQPTHYLDPSGRVTVYVRGGPSKSQDFPLSNYYSEVVGSSDPFFSVHNSSPGNAVNTIIDELEKDPCQPVIVLGYSWGGYTAAEVTRKLENRQVNGEDIAVTFLGTIDPIGKIIFRNFRVGSNVSSAVNYYQRKDFLLKGNPLIGGVSNHDWTNETPSSGGQYDHFNIIFDAREPISERVKSILSNREQYRLGARE